MMRTLLSTVCGLLAVLFLASGAHAQSFQGGLRGTVKDAQGVIPGATVTMTNQQNNTMRETQTNGAGEYSFPAVEPGTYQLVCLPLKVEGCDGAPARAILISG